MQAGPLQTGPNAKQLRAAVFSTVGCPYCKRAKDLLKAQQVPFFEVELSLDSDLRSHVKAVCKSLTVPQVIPPLPPPPSPPVRARMGGATFPPGT